MTLTVKVVFVTDTCWGRGECQTATGKSDIPGEPEHGQEKTSLKPRSQQSTAADASGSVFCFLFLFKYLLSS